MIKQFRLFLTACALLPLAHCLHISHAASTDASPSKRPNVIVILADDIGAHELGVYGHPIHQTPNLDTLAQEGIYFTTGYTNPICHPTRFAIMTGQYPHNNGVYHFPNRPGGPPVANEGADDITNHTTFGQIFQNAGYATAHAGKWQLSGEHPTLIHEAGFDDYMMWAYKHNLPTGAKHSGMWENNAGKTARFWHPSIVSNGRHIPTTAESYGPDMFVDFIVDFMADHKEEPFFVYYPMAFTHSPFWPTPDQNPSLAEKPRNSKQNWQANVEYMDKCIGRIVRGLEELGLRENTLIIFVGDNGTGGNGKGQSTEMGARVPFIASGPSIVKPQGESMELVDITDVLPTICEVARIELPEDLHIDGVSFAPYFRGKTNSLREWVYAPLGTQRVLRTKRWLLENNSPGSFGQLYDCGNSRDGTGYEDVTNSKNPEVLAAKKQLEKILADKPVPSVLHDELERTNQKSKKSKQKTA
ncbi:MAG: sulfatase-like hydrolase/transferase [Verrucomicrobiota bacterium]